MTAAILQGTPSTTLDVDLWINLPPRQYIRIPNLCRSLGAEIVANTVVVFDGQLTVNFLYQIVGLKSFNFEYSHAKRLKWQGETFAVLPLHRVYKSKKAADRLKISLSTHSCNEPCNCNDKVSSWRGLINS